MEVIHLKPQILTAFVSHILVAGKSGSGKSMAAEYFLENIYLRGGYKIVDVYDNGRFENCMYSLPSNNPQLVNGLREYSSPPFIKTKSGKQIWTNKPAVFPNEVYLFCGPELQIRNKFPGNFKIVSFDMKDINISDCYYLFGSQKSVYGVIATINYLFGEDVSLKEIGEILALGTFRSKRFNPRLLNISPQTKGMMLRYIRRWETSGLFSEKAPKLDFVKILNDTKTITSFSTALLDEESENVAYGLVLKKIFEMKRSKVVKPAMRIYIRELSNFMSPRWAFSYQYIKRLMREGRDILGSQDGKKGGMICDTQNVSDVKDEIVGQFGYYWLLKMDFWLCEKIAKLQEIPKSVIAQVPRFKTGQALILTGSSWAFPCQFPPTRHKHKEEGMDVLKLLGAKYGFIEHKYENYMDEVQAHGLDGLEDEELIARKLELRKKKGKK